MKNCSSCAVDVEGSWTHCPLCSELLDGGSVANPIPAVPLRFSRKRVFRALLLASITLILASFLVQLFFIQDEANLGALNFVWLGVVTMWLVVLMAVRQRHNVAKGTVYLVVVVGLLSVYWDYLTDWHGWALSYVVPIMCASSIAAVLITVRVMRMAVGDHILYSGLTVLLGLTPIVFLLLNWVTTPLPSALCGVLSLITLVLLQLSRGRYVRHELAKRLHV